jgi:putative Holliday junction resolvase
LGDARGGLALSDPSGLLAMPPATLSREGRGVTALASAIAETATAAGAVCVVVGFPLNMDGTEGPKAKEARRLTEALDSAGVSVRLQDERRSTVEAHERLRSAGRKTKDHRAVVDQAAAVVILQAALDAARAGGALG